MQYTVCVINKEAYDLYRKAVTGLKLREYAGSICDEIDVMVKNRLKDRVYVLLAVVYRRKAWPSSNQTYLLLNSPVHIIYCKSFHNRYAQG